MTLLRRIEIPNYIKEVRLSKGRRPIYYYKGKDKIPKKYQKNGYSFKKGILFDPDGKKVVKNKGSINKPRKKRILGQDIWKGINFNLRSKIAKEMKKYFYSHFQELDPLLDEKDYPIGIRIDIYDLLDAGEDLDNMIYFYRKTIHDALCGNVEFYKKEIKKEDGTISYENIPDREKYPQLILDDDKKHIQDIPTKFYPIKEDEDGKIVIEIFKI